MYTFCVFIYSIYTFLYICMYVYIYIYIYHIYTYIIELCQQVFIDNEKAQCKSHT